MPNIDWGYLRSEGFFRGVSVTLPNISDGAFCENN